MKISKRQLRRIIKEEKRKLLREQAAYDIFNDGMIYDLLKNDIIDYNASKGSTASPAGTLVGSSTMNSLSKEEQQKFREAVGIAIDKLMYDFGEE